MFGANPFASVPFASTLSQGVIAAAEVAVGGHSGPGRGKKRRRPQEYDWPAMIWPREIPLAKPWPETPPEIEVAPVAELPVLKAPAYVPKPEMVRAIAKPVDPAIRNKIMDLHRRMRMELEDEEALLLLGAFD